MQINRPIWFIFGLLVVLPFAANAIVLKCAVEDEVRNSEVRWGDFKSHSEIIYDLDTPGWQSNELYYYFRVDGHHIPATREVAISRETGKFEDKYSVPDNGQVSPAPYTPIISYKGTCAKLEVEKKF